MSYLLYEDGEAAIRFLTDAFAFREGDRAIGAAGGLAGAAEMTAIRREIPSPREIRARVGGRRRSDGGRHRAGRGGLGPACLAVRAGAGSSRARARDDAQEPGQARRERRAGP